MTKTPTDESNEESESKTDGGSNSDAPERHGKLRTDGGFDDDGPETDVGTTNAATVTPYEVTGEVDFDRLRSEFGTDPLTDDRRAALPDHPLVRRGIFDAGRSVDAYCRASADGDAHALVTGRGPSGPMHLGHVLPFYLARRFQEATDATVYLPLSDDEKFLAKDQSFESIGEHARENLRDVLAVGFDPERTRIVIDTADADVLYPIAVRLSKYLTPATIEAVYGDQDSVGLQFYPAVQATHLLLPQLVEGRQPTLVPIAIDQDPHVRVCRDVAAKEALPVSKPGALLGKFLPSLAGPGKMSSSGDEPTISLTDDADAVAETIRRHAYTGGRDTVAEHRERGGDPAVDVPFQYLRFGFEPDDERVAEIESAYERGDLTSGELKEIAIECIGGFLADHQRRRAELGDLEPELAPYRLTDDERERALRATGVPRLV